MNKNFALIGSAAPRHLYALKKQELILKKLLLII